MRVLAIDLGSKRIGVAVSDELGITARPLETIKRSGIARDLDRVKFLVNDLAADVIVVGLPLRMDGSVGSAARGVMNFVEKLKRHLADIDVLTQDERLTSYEADTILAERGYNRAERRAKSDEVAAMIILQDFLAGTKKEI
ncbi:MAG TPA: Holliday junction resolvase RuvX [Blastocatellia bacterium]